MHLDPQNQRAILDEEDLYTNTNFQGNQLRYTEKITMKSPNAKNLNDSLGLGGGLIGISKQD